MNLKEKLDEIQNLINKVNKKMMEFNNIDLPEEKKTLSDKLITIVHGTALDTDMKTVKKMEHSPVALLADVEEFIIALHDILREEGPFSKLGFKERLDKLAGGRLV